MKTRSLKTKHLYAIAATAVLTLQHPLFASACSFTGYKRAAQNTSSTYASRGVGGYIYSTLNTINDVNFDHVVYSFWMLPNPGSAGACDTVIELGRSIGNSSGYALSSPYTFSYNKNDYVYGNGTCKSGGGSTAFHSYGAPTVNEGYWTYPTGYRVLGQLGEGYEYQYDFDYGSLGNHAPNSGWSTSTSGYPGANSEVYQGNGSVGCEAMNAYWGTNNGTPSTSNQMALTSSTSTSPSFTQWSASVPTNPSADPGYAWTVLNSFWAAHSYGSPS